MNLLTIVCGTLAATTAVAEPVHLPTLLRAASQHHPVGYKAALVGQRTDAAVRQLDRDYWPRLSVAAQGTWQSEVTGVTLPLPGASLTPPPKTQMKVALEAQQTLWDGGVIAAQQAAQRAAGAAEEAKADAELLQLQERVMQLYLNAVVLQETQRQTQATAAYLAQQLTHAEVAWQQGVISQKDVLLLRARQVETKQAHDEAALQLDAVCQALTILSGEHIAPSDVFVAEPPGGAPPASVDQRPELTALTAQRRWVTAQDNVMRAKDYPKLGLFGSAGYGRPGLNMLNSQFDTYYLGGVQLSVPLAFLYSGSHRLQTQQTNAHVALVKADRDALTRQLQVQLAQANAEVNRLATLMASDDELVQLRTSIRQQTEVQYTHGTASMNDLLTDLTQEEAARSKTIIHRAQWVAAQYQVRFQAGDTMGVTK